jgi:dTDP-glucose 4,6-dehydratase
VGPYLPLDNHHAIGNFIRDGLQDGFIQVKGDGTPHRSYLYAADLAIWLWTILFHGFSCRPYNVGSEVDLSISALAKNVAETFPTAPEVRIAKKAISNEPSERYVPSTSRAKLELGLSQQLKLHEAIGRTACWNEQL